MIVTPPSAEEVTGHAAAMYDSDTQDEGYVFAHTQVMAINPEAHEAFERLIKAIVSSIGLDVYEAATLGAARAIRTSHCLCAHGRKALRAEVLDDAGLRAFARHDDSGFSEPEQAVVRFAEQLSLDAAAMTDADSQVLRDVGFTDRQIVDITLAAAARNFFSRTLLALDVPVDVVPGLDPMTAAALMTAR